MVMMTLKQVKDRADTFLGNLWSVVQTRQAAYFASHGAYWQGLYTHTAHDGETETEADLLDSHPTDQASSWRDVLADRLDGVALPCRLRCDVYESPNGWGYWVTAEVEYRGVVYSRSKGEGPENHDRGWEMVESDAPE